MELNRCKTCGGSLERQGNYFVCDSCGNKWEIDRAEDSTAVDRANAWNALRDGDFDSAAELFEEIISKDKDNHEAYWGRALATNGIIYVTDLNENKKVPTCNNITGNSFIENRDVKTAISLAEPEIAANYKEQANKIEAIRVEWFEKASREKPYDIFISFKDSDRQNGIERTQDSIDAQELYTMLVDQGYKVFYSRVSLRDKVSEQYEPYIYNALKTAKVMIVFGSKAEYFASTWIKNEWSRYIKRIESGEKHKNSLVVVTKGVEPADLPVALGRRQCLKFDNMYFLTNLKEHIARVMAESKENAQLQRISIEGGQIAKKATSITTNTIQTKEIGVGKNDEIDISEKQSINLIYSYLDAGEFREANDLIKEVLFDNPSCAEALWCKMLAKYRVPNNMKLMSCLGRFNQEDCNIVEASLSNAGRDFAKGTLVYLYNNLDKFPPDISRRILNIILPYDFEGRDMQIKAAIERVSKNSRYQMFEVLLGALRSDEVDAYIACNFAYANNTRQPDEKVACYNRILSVDEGNTDALCAILFLDLERGTKPMKDLIAGLEKVLKYASDVKSAVVHCLKWINTNITNDYQFQFAKQLLRYYPGALVEIKDTLNAIGRRLLIKHQFEEALYFFELVISVDKNNADAFWGICLAKTRSRTESEVIKSEILIRDVPEFNKYLTCVDDVRRKACIKLSKDQGRQLLSTMKSKIDAENRILNTMKSSQNYGKKKGGFIVGLLLVAVFILIFLQGAWILDCGSELLDALDIDYDEEVLGGILMGISGIGFLINSIVGGVKCGKFGEVISESGIFFLIVLYFYLIFGWFFYIPKLFKINKEAKQILGNISLGGRTLPDAIKHKEEYIAELTYEYDAMYKQLN